ncbi:dehydratase [Pasteurellaceae bacterium RH1A]|nr:dehydratase [Pasteurellaceae bacterium RH1A]
MLDLTCPITHISPLLPHSGEMVFLDAITAFGDDFLTAQTTVRSDNLLIKHGKLASFVGAEIMAQGVAAWAGCKCVQAGKPIELGYWLGSRKLQLHCAEIPIGQPLEIQIKLSIEDATGFGVFDCQMRDLETGQVLIEGALNVFRPQANNT